MATLHQQITKLQESADMLEEIQAMAKTNGGRLTDFGKNLLHVCTENKMQVTKIAKLLNVTPAAVTQNQSKLK